MAGHEVFSLGASQPMALPLVGDLRLSGWGVRIDFLCKIERDGRSLVGRM